MFNYQDIQSGYEMSLPFEATVIARAPGRINIIGEHTDYNGGFVLPAAIDKAILFAIRKREEGASCILHSLDKNEQFEFHMASMTPGEEAWPNYIKGVVSELQKLGGEIGPFEAAFGGNVSVGAGMSSSAALECSAALAINELFQLGFDKQELMLAAQKAEHNYVGNRCGIMDQFASMNGQFNAVIQLDCKNLDYSYFPLNLGDYTLLFLNSKVSHSLAESAYNDRRAACEKGVAVLSKYYPEVKYLRDASLAQLDEVRGELDSDVYIKCKFIIEEIERVVLACNALEQKDFQRLGSLMYRTHEGLSNEYEVSCKEVDFLVEATKDKSYILGSRIMGGGFGGCSINLMEKARVSEFIKMVQPAYKAEFGIDLEVIEVKIGKGAEVVLNKGQIDFDNDPHRRYNILTGEWVQVSPHRTKRPWQGKQEVPDLEKRPSYDPNCYLCPGNTRAGGKVNPDYKDTFVFDNDFGALLPNTKPGEFVNGLMRASTEQGICRVICFSNDHSLTLPEMERSAIRKVVDLWKEQYEDLGAKPFINHVQIFENKGQIMGCSNPHPHGQIWAQRSIPQEASKKLIQQKDYWEKTGRSLLGDYLNQELLKPEERIIINSDYFVALVPFWATWPYECMIIPKRHIQDIGQMSEVEKDDFASILKQLTIKLDNLFQCSFPYSSGLVQRPTDGQQHPWWHFHMSFYPPLLRSARVKKFMVGYEMFANPQRDLSAEQAASKIRSQGEVHYKKL